MREPIELFHDYVRLERKRAAEGLTPAELERFEAVKRQLNRRFSPAVPRGETDRRGSVRVPTRVALCFGTLGELRRCLMTELSRGGLFVQTRVPMPIGTKLDLRIEIERSGEVIEVPVEVVTVGGGPDLRDTRPGMGVRFADMPDDVRKRIDDLYERALREAVDRMD